jgi:hypothetical protein
VVHDERRIQPGPRPEFPPLRLSPQRFARTGVSTVLRSCQAQMQSSGSNEVVQPLGGAVKDRPACLGGKEQFTRRSQKSQRNGGLRIQRVAKPDRSSRSLRSPCVKLRSEKIIHTEIAKNTKERRTTDLRVTQIGSVLVIFAISVCKTPVRKGDPHGDRKGRMITD